jgi:hypothetical protein
MRRHSVGSTGMRQRDSRDLSPGRPSFCTGFFSGAANGANEFGLHQKPKSRRHFYQEGVNPPPTVSAEPQTEKEEGKQA